MTAAHRLSVGVSTLKARSRLWRTTLICWSVAFVAILLWSVATPMWTAPDATAHGMRAYAVGQGQVVADPVDGAYVSDTPVPQGLLESSLSVDCRKEGAGRTAACVKLPDPEQSAEVSYYNPAGRYIPTYYLLVGPAASFAPLEYTWYAQNFVASFLASFFVGLAGAAALSCRSRALALTGLVVACSPMVLWLGGVTNPQSLEIVAALAMVACTLVFLAQPDTWLGRAMFARAMVAAGAMIAVRSVSPVWVAVWFCAFALLASGPVWRALRTRRNLAWMGLPTAAVAVSAAWTLSTDVGDITATQAHDFSWSERLQLSWLRIDPGTVQEMVGWFGWLDTTLDVAVVHLYQWPALAVVVLAVAFLRTREVLAVGFLAVCTYVLPIVMQAANWNMDGQWWQGRYTLPLMVMVPLTALMLAAQRVDLADRSLPTRKLVWLVPVLLAPLAYVHVEAFRTHLGRNVNAGRGDSALDGPWEPPVNAETWMFGYAALVVLTWLCVAWLYRREGSTATGGTEPVAVGSP